MRYPLVRRVHEQLAGVIGLGEWVIDATVGNGHDTAFLAQAVGDSGWVFGFDVQRNALNVASNYLQQLNLSRQVTLIQAGHETLLDYLPTSCHGAISAVMFNLGFLPGSDKSVITSAHTTLQALDIASKLLKRNGVISVIAYPGHEGGREETEAIKLWANTLPSALYQVTIYIPDSRTGLAPQWIKVAKR